MADSDRTPEQSPPTGALQGISVLDMARLVPGAWCAQVLGDLGADVVRVEAPAAAMRQAFLACVNRNKRSVVIDIKSDQGRDILFELVRKADVLVEDAAPGIFDRLGLSRDTLEKENQNLVHCSLTGYGHTGPLAGRPAHEINFYALSGLLSLNRDPAGRPVIPGTQITAGGAGAWPAAGAILAALVARQRTDRGQHIDMALYDGTVALAMLQSAAVFSDDPHRAARLTGRYACYHIYRTADNEWISAGALEPQFWKIFCERLGLEDLIPRQFDESIVPEVEAAVAAHTLDQIVDMFADEPACVEPVREFEDVLENDVQLKERGMMVEQTAEGRTVRAMGNPVNMSDTPWAVRRGVPDFGEHTRDVLAELGRSEDEIQELYDKGIVK